MLNKIGVIGAGQMGSGIAHVCAQAEHDVVIVDIDENALTKSVERIAGNMDRQVKRTLIAEEDKAAALARIATATGLDALADCDLVIEAATEDEATKIRIFCVPTFTGLLGVPPGCHGSAPLRASYCPNSV